MRSDPHWNENPVRLDNRRESSTLPDFDWDHEDSRIVRFERAGGFLNKARARTLRALNRLVRLRGSPEEIAWGLSIGLFIAMTPTVGMQMAIAIPVATALRGNPAAAAAGCWLTNPLTIPVLYGLNYWLGATILGYDQSFEVHGPLTFDLLVSSGSHVWWSLIVGGVITGLLSAVIAYYPTLYLVRAGRASLAKRKARRQAAREAARRASAAGSRALEGGSPVTGSRALKGGSPVTGSRALEGGSPVGVKHSK